MEVEALAALQSDPGWLLLVGKMEDRKKQSMKKLCSAKDFNEVLREQIVVQEMNWCMNAPRLLLQELKQKEIV